MQIAIVGLAGAGKTTVFNTLTRGHAETGGYGALQLNVGVVKVPDPRLDKLAEVFKPKKIVQADITYVDLPAPPASSEGRVGTDELPAEHMARLREADALIHVVRAWDDAAHPHPAGSVDAARDIEQLDLEFMLADLAMIDRRLERLQAGGGRHGTPAEREANEREEVILVRLKAVLEGDRPIRDEPLDPDDEKAIRGFRFLTQKPVLILVNVGEGDLAGAPAEGRGDRRRLRPPARAGRRAVRQDRDGAGRARPRRGGGVHGGAGPVRVEPRPGDRPLVPAVGLISFLTAGPDEVRAWPIPDGSNAVDAAGAIHTDLAKGFIRAETIGYEELLAAGSMAEAKRHGKVRSEGKTYRVRDGDVMEILFSR